MKLIIDISEEDYNNIEPFFNGQTIKGGFNLFKALEIIKNGIPLDDLRAEIKNDWQLKKYPSSPFSCGLRRAIEIIDRYKAERSK